MTYIKCYLWAQDAVRIGRGDAGRHNVAVGEADLAGLDGAERAALARYATDRTSDDSNDRLRLESAPTPAGVVTALRRDLAASAKQDADAAARREAEIAAAVAAEDSEWVGGGDGPCWYENRDHADGYSRSRSGVSHGRPIVRKFPSGTYLADDLQRDPRVIARRAEVDARALPAVVAEWERQYAEWSSIIEAAKREKEAADRAKEDRGEVARAALRAHARTIDGLARAEAEGYDVEGAAFDHVVDALKDKVAAEYRIVDVHSSEERAAPRPEALHLRDQVTRAVADLARPACVEVDVSRVHRIDATCECESCERCTDDCEACRGCPPVTGVVVTVRCDALGWVETLGITAE